MTRRRGPTDRRSRHSAVLVLRGRMAECAAHFRPTLPRRFHAWRSGCRRAWLDRAVRVPRARHRRRRPDAQRGRGRSVRRCGASHHERVSRGAIGSRNRCLGPGRPSQNASCTTLSRCRRTTPPGVRRLSSRTAAVRCRSFNSHSASRANPSA